MGHPDTDRLAYGCQAATGSGGPELPEVMEDLVGTAESEQMLKP